MLKMELYIAQAPIFLLSWLITIKLKSNNLFRLSLILNQAKILIHSFLSLMKYPYLNIFCQPSLLSLFYSSQFVVSLWTSWNIIDLSAFTTSFHLAKILRNIHFRVYFAASSCNSTLSSTIYLRQTSIWVDH